MEHSIQMIKKTKQTITLIRIFNFKAIKVVKNVKGKITKQTIETDAMKCAYARRLELQGYKYRKAGDLDEYKKSV